MNKSILSLATMMAVASNVDAANGTGQQNSAQQNKRPNIIFFLVDDMGWQDTSLPFWTQKTHYNEVYETPNMERLAKRGMMFTQAYAASVSSPSRCSLITGANNARHRVTNWTLERDKSVFHYTSNLFFKKGISDEKFSFIENSSEFKGLI